MTAAQAAFVVAYSTLPEPYRSAAAFSVATRAWWYVVLEVMYTVSARYQILSALFWPIPVTLEPSHVGLPSFLFAADGALPSASRKKKWLPTPDE